MFVCWTGIVLLKLVVLCLVYICVVQVLDERSKLHAAWQNKKVYLDQLIDLHFFLRDAKQLDTISSTQEAYLSSADFGTTIEQVDAQVMYLSLLSQ